MDYLEANESEIAILGIILNNPEQIYEIKTVRPVMFSSLAHRVVFSEFEDMRESEQLPNRALLREKLATKKELDKVGGDEYLKFLETQNYPVENLAEHERIVCSSYKKRELLNLSARIPERINETVDIDALISDLRGSLDLLTSASGAEKSFLVGDLLPEVLELIEERKDNPNSLAGIPFGNQHIDEALGGIRGGELVFVASRPSMGKTAVMCNSAIELAKKGIPSLIFQFEMGKFTQVERLIAVEGDISVLDIRLGKLDEEKFSEVMEAIDRIAVYPIFIDEGQHASLNYVLQTIRKHHKEHGVKMVFIDYVQLMAERDADLVKALGRISRGLKLIAKELDIAIVVLSQVNRNVEMRMDKKPILSDLRDSGNLEEDADLVAVLYRDAYYTGNYPSNDIEELQFIVRKNRSGPIKTLRLNFNRVTNKLS